MKVHKLEIVTPVYNRCEETLQCLRSLSRIDRTRLEAHVIVVDDGSTDGTADALAKDFPDVEVIPGDGNLWYTAGTNRGLKAALQHDPDYILAINNDSVFDEKCLHHLIECAEKYPRSIVGPLLLDWTAPHKVFQVAPHWELISGGYRHWFKQTVWTVPRRAWEVELIVGNCVLYPVEAIREGGLMDETRLPQFGDAEYTPRMRRLGWRLMIEPRARVFCKPNNLISGFRNMPLSEKLRQLFLNPVGPYSFQRRVYGNLGGAPNLFQGIVSIPIYYLRAFLKRGADSARATRYERPLSATFTSLHIEQTRKKRRSLLP